MKKRLILAGCVLALLAAGLLVPWIRVAPGPVALNTVIVRDALNRYDRDKGREPACLDQLVKAGYLRSIPNPLPSEMEEVIPAHCQSVEQ
jgi:hypothetical protein